VDRSLTVGHPWRTHAPSGLTPHISGSSLSATVPAGTRRYWSATSPDGPIRDEYLIVDGGASQVSERGIHRQEIVTAGSSEGAERPWARGDQSGSRPIVLVRRRRDQLGLPGFSRCLRGASTAGLTCYTLTSWPTPATSVAGVVNPASLARTPSTSQVRELYSPTARCPTRPRQCQLPDWRRRLHLICWLCGWHEFFYLACSACRASGASLRIWSA